MARPTKITPDPIIDAIVEFRFENNVPPDAILGMLFNVVRDDFPEFVKLPIAELPEKIRAQDSTLKFAPFLAKLVKNLEASGVVKKFTRIGIRYIDFFKNDIFEKITLSINLNDAPLKSAQTTLTLCL